MTNWIDSMYYWIGSMSESGLNNRIEETKKEIDWLTEEMIPIAHMMNSSAENGLKTRRDQSKRRLSKLQYKLLKKKNQGKVKIKINCPQCGRSLKGATQDMIRDIGVCPNCKSEFTIEQKGNNSKEGLKE